MFLKPVFSKYKETQNKDFYYIAKVSNIKKVMTKYGLGGEGDFNFGYPHYLNKKDIDKLPRYLRRGGEYGHDPVIIDKPKEYYLLCSWPSKYITHSHLLNLCKVYGLEIILR